ncbi:ATP-binding protein [Sansalvadorimonas verongulae]|uniref:ATP-binding protein n=1 Tax=Sansalvadorimonas verongulae TaxID=2172824 RepID=UPI0012BD52F2|nr:AAA family ATPase [Sansalvadorimonas verongulae]MTI11834.1 ATP-binding protein [Sansalvadorimonas verongulae]
MKRLLLQKLLAWKEQSTRKPVLLDGARQTGKSFLLEKLFGGHFNQVIRLDFLEQPGLANLFADSLSPEDILTNIELELNISINRHQSLIIFDEIGECQPAINSLKFFAEQCPEMYICASGSNIGLLGSFPVGKVEMLELYPFTFEEFIWASNQAPLTKAFDQMNMGKVAHEKLFSRLIDYYFVGGMPEAVKAWFETEGDLGITERIQRIQEIHSALLAGYERDFGKYSDKVPAQHIQAVFENVPVQLSKNIDDSVQRFKFKDVIEKKNRYKELAGPINWLEKCRLISKCHPVDCHPTSPLKPLAKDNIFKLFLFDVGLLGHMLGISYKEHREQKYHYKGYVAENFVQNELINRFSSPTYSWEYARSEIEFLYKTDTGDIIPVEVKSGKRTRAKSLKTYVQRYSPTATLKLIGSAGSLDDPTAKVLPLYYVSRIREVLG